MLNHIEIMGRFIDDPEILFTQSQNMIATFTLAVDRDFGAAYAGGQSTDKIKCVAWRSTAEFINKYFLKGSYAVVCGRLQAREWEDCNGYIRITTEVVVENIYFDGSRLRKNGYFQKTDFSDPPQKTFSDIAKELDADDLIPF